MELEEDDLNLTELRAIYAAFGLRFSREATKKEIIEAFDSGRDVETDQAKLRKKTEKFVTDNWKYLKGIAEVYGCTGDCSSPNNLCTDARASMCFIECFPKKRKRR